MYGGKLLSEGGYGCVYYPEINCLGKEEKNSNYVTKIQKNDDSAENEIEISNKIMKIQNYNFFFGPVTDSCKINISEINKGLVENCELIKKNGKEYILMKIKHIGKDDLLDNLLSTENKQIMNSLLDNYIYLLNSINILYKNNIIHYDLKENNIMIDKKTKLPKIIDFGMSIDLNKVNENLDFYFFRYAPEYYVWCPEIHILNYVINERSVLKKEDIEKICNDVVNNNKILKNIYSDNFIKKYKELMVKYNLRYKGLSKQKIIDELLKTSYTWDNYSLCIIYLKILKYLFPYGFNENNFIISFSEILLYNINPDPYKRLNIKKTEERFNNNLLKINNDKNKDYKSILNSLREFEKKRNKMITLQKKELLKINIK